ncbi:MAG: hypothetical protein ACR2IH_06395 [Pyrinomonadaceae bacterium]
MHDVKHTLDIKMRTKLRLSEIERLIKKHRIIVPPLSRATLVNFCEDGTFETAGERPTSLGWLVFEDSFWKWAEGLDGGSSRRQSS